jgi:hypothetical protein
MNFPLNKSIPRFLLIICVLVFISLNTSVFALNYESFVSLEEDKVELHDPTPGAQFGASLSNGDYNGDGVDDLAVGAPFASLDEKEWNGAVYIIFGQSKFENDIIDLSQTSQNIVFKGATSGDQLGTALTSGDYNNDGIDDLAIGAYSAYSNDIHPGKVYVFLGKSTWADQSIDMAIDTPDFEYIGEGDNDNFGLSLFTIDINDDSIDDLFIGAPFKDTPLFEDSGAVYAYLGSDEGLSPLFDYLIYANSEFERFGSAITGGDINAGPENDIAIGAYFAKKDDLEQTGKVYIYSDFEDFDSNNNYSASIEGSESYEWFGFSLDINDVNGDGKDDIAVGSFPFNGIRSNSKISIFYGDKVFSPDVDIAIEKPLNESILGADVLLKDLNLDNNAEIIMGAPGIGHYTSSDEGDVYILYNQDIQNTSSFSIQEQDMTSIVHGENADDWFGYKINVLDINGDGYEDLAVGSRYSDSDSSKNNGKVFIIFGDGIHFGKKIEMEDFAAEELERGEFINIVIERFSLKNKNADVITNCYNFKEFCFFNFLAASSYDDIQLEPEILLYPDIPVDYEYYEEVLIATMLDLMNGYLTEENSPFRPERSVSRIQALKVILAAADLVPGKYRFELIDILGSLENLKNQFSYFADVDARIFHMWWYPRYVNFAVETGLVDKGFYFKPDQNITKAELDDMIERTLEFINSANEEIDA